MAPKEAYLTSTADILVVDDNIDNLRLLTRILTQAGYRVRSAEKPQLAIESALAYPPGLILLDVMMPEMSGFEVCHRLKQDERTREIPVIFVSALQDVDDRVQGFEAGGVDFVSKPFQKTEVLARVKTHLQLRAVQLQMGDLVAERTAELTEANAELRVSEARFRATFEQAAVGIAHVTPDGRFLRLNQRFCDIVGYSHDEMVARTFQDITHPDDLDTDLEHMRQLLAGETATYAMEKRYLRIDGEVVWVNLTVSLVRKATGEPDYFVSVVEDITARKKLQEERDRILELSQDLICIAGMDGYFKYLSPAWESTLGYTSGELLARPFLDFIHPDDHTRNDAEVESLAAGHQTLDFENRYIHKDGSIRYISWKATPLLEENVMYCIGRDMTVRKQAELEILEYQQRLKALATELTLAEERERRRIASDLHDHVGQSLAFARIQLAAARKATSETRRNTSLDSASQTLRETIQATRNLVFELSSPLLNEIGLEAALSEWADENVRKPTNLAIQVVDSGREKPLSEDVRAILFRNVRELLTNVIKHANATSVCVRLERMGEEYKISVADDGDGMDSNAAAQKVKRQGGFGLFSIQERMNDLGGTLQIVSAPGQGCTAILTAPLVNVSGPDGKSS